MSAFIATPVRQCYLARRNPTVKLAVLALASAVAMFVFDPLTAGVLYAVAVAAVALGLRPDTRSVVIAHLPFLAFAASVFTVNMLTRPGAVVWQAGFLRITQEGMSVGAALGARTLFIGILAVAFIRSTDGVALMTSLHHNAKLNARLTYAILTGYRMLQEMPAEWSTIRHAHAVRLPQPSGRRPNGPRHLAGVVFTLLVVSLRKGERMAQALESRGLGRHPRTTWQHTPVRTADWVLAGAVVVVLIGILVLSMRLGVFRGPGALTT